MMAPGILIFASTASEQSQVMPPNKSRPDSPGGYFTLSDSDGASANGIEVPIEQDEEPQQKVALYKLFRSPSNRSDLENPFTTSNGLKSRSEATGRRPDPCPETKEKLFPRQPIAKITRKPSRDETPPRPPPPLSYTSTLPPPVPKKTFKQSGTSQIFKRPDQRPSITMASSFKSKPLQRVQPLQIQSPSVLRALTSTTVASTTSSSSTSTGYMSSGEDNTQSSLESNSATRPVLPVKKRSPPPRTSVNRKTRPSSSNSSEVGQTSTSFVKSFQQAKSSSTDSLSSNTSVAAIKKPSQKFTSLSSKKILPTKEDKFSPQPKPLLKTTSDLTQKSSKAPLRAEPSKQIQRKTTSPDLTNVKPPALPAKRIIGQLNSIQPTRQLVRSTSTGTTRPPVDLRSRQQQVQRSNSNHLGPDHTQGTGEKAKNPTRPTVQQKLSSSSFRTTTSRPNLVSRRSSSSELPSHSQKAVQIQKKSTTDTLLAPEKGQHSKRNASMNRANSATREIEKTVQNVQTHLKNSICSLVKLYEMNPQKRMASKEETLSQKTQPASKPDPSTSTNQLSSERLQTWLANPLPSLDSKDFSMMEVDILDQYVTQMLSFTRGALSSIETPRQSLIQIEKPTLKIEKKPSDEECNLKVSVQAMVNKLELEDQPKQVHHQPSLTVTKSTDPSEEDLSRGVFTEVSFAGTFAPSQKPIVKITPTIQKQERVDPEEIRISSTPDPVPSPRLKRKARKEQMLKEHKEAGREALSMLVKNVQPNKTNSADVNAMLDDLCKHGADVERDIDEGRKLSRLWSQDAARKHKIEVPLRRELNQFGEKTLRLEKQVVRLQAVCRGFLARRRVKKLEVQHKSVCTLQKNFRSFMSLRRWPWWRLLIRITPIIEVKKIEQQIENRTNEVNSLRNLLDEEQNVRTILKAKNEQLEIKVIELTNILSKENTKTSKTIQDLEVERVEWLKEKQQLEDKIFNLQSSLEDLEKKLEMARTAAKKDEELENDALIYRQKYDRTAKELEATRKRLQQQHEDDMEQLVAMKKQLEKKLNESYEEVNDQRQTVAQWKRKFQVIQAELNDSKSKFEEQTSRNTVLEKRQRKIEAELSLLQEDRKSEAISKDKIQKENEWLKSTKFSLEDKIQSLISDLDSKQEKIAELMTKMDDLRASGVTEEDVSLLKRHKLELETKLKEGADEMEDLNGQIQILEQMKEKMEISIAEMKKNHKRELTTKDEELEDCRAGFQKKLKTLEQQVESDHEERLTFVREKHELESKVKGLQEVLSRSADEEQVIKLKKDLKRTKALLKDAQLMLDKSTSESSNKVFIRQLKNQLEDSEFAKTAAVKAKQNVELELSDVQAQLDDILRRKSEMDDRIHRMSREKADLTSQLDDAEEELQEVMKKYKSTVSQLSVDHLTIQDQNSRLVEMEEEKNRLKEQNADLIMRIESLESDSIVNVHHNKFEFKIKELETRLELEQTTRSRMETQLIRLKEGIEKISDECDSLRHKEATSQEQVRKLQRQLRDLHEDRSSVLQKEMEAVAKKNDLEKQLELVEAENILARNDLKLSLKRVEDLQAAISEDLESELEFSTSDTESEAFDESFSSYINFSRKVPEKHILTRFEGSFSLLEESSA